MIPSIVPLIDAVNLPKSLLKELVNGTLSFPKAAWRKSCDGQRHPSPGVPVPLPLGALWAKGHPFWKFFWKKTFVIIVKSQASRQDPRVSLFSASLSILCFSHPSQLALPALYYLCTIPRQHKNSKVSLITAAVFWNSSFRGESWA